ncbi:MAG: hypothetical protein LBE38_06140 [Deltaproteobacteria bacterium]|jgi:hypothetical protein|nr:hypothetical protein [Deltaproteobacteria bacterium]
MTSLLRLGVSCSILLVAIFCLTITSTSLSAQAKESSDLELLDSRLSFLKEDFETSLADTSDQELVQAMAWKAISLSFLASVSSFEPERYDGYFEMMLESFEVPKTNGKKTPSVDHLIINSMRLCDEALARLIVILAGRNKNTKVLAEFEAIMAHHGVDAGKARTQPAQLAEMKVFWSNRLVALYPLVIKILAPEKEEELQDVTEDLLNRAEIIASRRDIHYQARMDLLYLNNVQTLTTMFFLLSTQQGSSIRDVASIMEDNWELSSKDQNLIVADKISLALVASAELSFPLSFSYVAKN